MRKIVLLTSILLLLIGKVSAESPVSTKNFVKFSVASWNIGHFALGKSADTKVKHAEVKDLKAAYHKFIDYVNADLMAVVEYSPDFVKAADGNPTIAAREAVFSNYQNAEIGPKHDYNCNAIFSNGFNLKKGEICMFDKKVQTRYYLCSETVINGNVVKVVSTHLDWNEGNNGAAYRALQIKELIERFKDDRYVILCADWNTSTSTSEYDPFTSAGYEMANHGYLGDLKTYPAGNQVKECIDNGEF